MIEEYNILKLNIKYIINSLYEKKYINYKWNIFVRDIKFSFLLFNFNIFILLYINNFDNVLFSWNWFISKEWMIFVLKILNNFKFEINEIILRIIIWDLLWINIIVEEIYENFGLRYIYMKNYNLINIIIIYCRISEFKKII